MGLDMFLTGVIQPNTKNLKTPDGDSVSRVEVELEVWRKHPNLHGYIVSKLGPKDADGKPIDDCNPINLSQSDLLIIFGAIKNDMLPKTSGFFFGKSDGSEKQSDLVAFDKTIKWLNKSTPSERRSVYYQASW